MGRTCVFDVEADGLLPSLTKLHSIVAIDVDTRECFDWRPHELEAGLRFLQGCECLIGHNILDYDLRAIERLYPWWERPAAVWDTLVMAKVVWPYDTLYGRDIRLVHQGRLPPRLLKSHSLKAWGLRLGNLKGDFDGPWEEWSEAMHTYMIQDARVNLELWDLIRKRIGWESPVGAYVWPELPFLIDQGAQLVCSEMEDTGFRFDRTGAVRLAQEMMNARADLEERLVAHFGQWWAPLDDPRKGRRPPKDRAVKRREFPDVVRPRYGARGQRLKDDVGPPLERYAANAPHVRIKLVAFSPSSRDHLGHQLQKRYGWKPRKFGKDGRPTLDEATIAEIPEEVLPADLRTVLQDYFVLSKVLGMLATGNKAWLRLLNEETGRLHGRVDPAGAITSRATHRDPNMTLVPSVEKEEGPDGAEVEVRGIEGGFGVECRRLFVPSPGNELTGTDVSSLELALLGHYLVPLDGGEFLARVTDPDRDAHTEHGAMTGLPRADTKTVTYAYVYGAGAAKVGASLVVKDDEVQDLLAYPSLKHMLTWLRKVEGADYREPDDRTKARMAKGHIVIKKFEAGIPGLRQLKEDVTATARQRGWLKAMDGRKLYVRKPHAALNTLLQGAGAIVCKQWMVLMHRKLAERGVAGRAKQVAWSHDETQWDHEPGLGGVIREVAQEAILEAGTILGFRGRLRADAKTGSSWADTH